MCLNFAGDLTNQVTGILSRFAFYRG
jgi:hypothetical protein